MKFHKHFTRSCFQGFYAFSKHCPILLIDLEKHSQELAENAQWEYSKKMTKL